MKRYTVIIFSFIFFPLFGQIDSLEEQLIKATLEFRSSILAISPNHYKLKKLEDRWKTIEPNDTITQFLIFNTFHEIQVYDSQLKNIKKWAEKSAPTSSLPDSITQLDLEILKINCDLFSFILDGYLDHDFPYKVKLDSFNLKEIEFINIKPHESVADIGSGTGNQTLLLSLMYPKNNFILTEVNYSLFHLLETKIDRFSELFFQEERSINVIRGKKKNLNLDRSVDKIIIRNSFHHFSKKMKMLESISSHLNKNGSVIFIEPLKSNKTSIDDCNLKMRREDIIDFIKSSSLFIGEEKIVNNTLFLLCKKKEKL